MAAQHRTPGPAKGYRPRMFLVILGLVLAIVGRALRAADRSLQTAGKVLGALGPMLVVAGLLLSAAVVVEVGTVGVIKLFGKVNPDVIEPGLHLVNPLANVVEVDVRTRNYTMSAVHDEGQKAGDDAIRALTSDGLEVVIDVTVLYRVTAVEAPRLLSEVGLDYEDVIVRPIARSRIRDATVYYQAVQLYTEKRDEFQLRVSDAITNELKARGIVVESLLVRNIALPESVKASIEEKIRAEQDSQKMVFVLQKESQEAERKRVEAQGIADYQRIMSSNLGDNQLRYEQIKAMRDLATSANAKVIVMSPNTPVILDAK
jgi:regulator of protease activity HflC (stomatin/prohibitin superfamily)